MPTARLEKDPNLETIPDFASEAYEVIRAALTTEERNEEQVVQMLAEGWQRENGKKKEQWAQQQEEDRLAEEEAQRQREEEEEGGEEEEDRDGAQQPRQSASKLALNPLAHGRVAQERRIPRPSNYALGKLRKREYVELWYFTEEGCEDAFRFDRSVSQDTFALSKVGEVVALQPIAALKPSQNALRDEELSWRQMSIAKTTLLLHMGEQGWPEDYVVMLAKFFVALDNHERRRIGVNGDKVLLLYQAEIRREWHHALTNPSGQAAFDISVISDERLRGIAEAHHVIERELLMAR